MEVWQWQQESLASRRYTVSGESGPIGVLAFGGWTSNDAEFSSERLSLHFQRQGWLEHDVTIRFKGEVVGMSKTASFGKTITTFVTGERYTLQGKTLNSSRDLTDEAGHVVMRFEQGDFSIRQGHISMNKEIPELTKFLLVAIGLYFKHLGQ
ncbi:hypothetical protein [Pontibacter roseus]|uniref:hypothetical protein n=1 Tax=Pontibacter roseus TaxID=336989 RepID=UPI000373CAE7|nr:hypothetical protein [Pontibacter roseus]